MMLVRPLSIMVCGADERALADIAQKLSSEGVRVQTTTQLVDCLHAAQQDWDFLLIDLNGLNSFLRSLVASLCRSFPTLPIIGISPTESDAVVATVRDLKLEYYCFEVPRPEELIVQFPHVASRYLCDTGALTGLGTSSLISRAH